MIGERTTSEETNARGRTEPRRIARAGAMLGVALAAVLGALVLASRRRDDATLEPPF